MPSKLQAAGSNPAKGTMSKLKNDLLARKKQLEQQLKGYDDILAELEEVNKALASLEPPKCSDFCSGCDICRRGPYYR